MFSITYGSGQIKGELIQDDIQIGNLKIEQQVFGAVTDEEGEAFIGVKYNDSIFRGGYIEGYFKRFSIR
jgi:hypothetical protein